MADYDCLTCTATFWELWDRDDHMDYYDHWPECETCPRSFGSWSACHQHMNATGHYAPRFYCETCNKEFRSEHASRQHMTSMGHWRPRIPCEMCNKVFLDEETANRHMKKEGHYKNYCPSCDIRFQNENNLRMHLNSKVHRGTNITCPFCKKQYTSVGGVAHHLERGSCPNAPRLNRETIYRTLRERDRTGVITNKLIEWKEEESLEYSATHNAFNGSSWECYVCHRKFRCIKSLNAHLNSPVHKQNLYHCPNLSSRCSKQFTTLASLLNHLESESCGLMRFEKVQDTYSKTIRGIRMISL
ncbi:hypothetical protein BDV25DRAFT_116490 [Aspergillus avenaceus]|uniref:C2H2-type domain-containing protein n=1 Tax=Aspergillus avenaceus TaxID=36643 RepID=A0A5N6U7F5_ASPAV|nr:hypothetical protein BDV25DRAFT_116490 [Aspergillus avenaceus]